MRFPIGLICSITALAAIAAGCGGEVGAPGRNGTGATDNILLVGNGAEPESLDPHISTGVPEHRLQLALFEGLVNLDPSDLSPVPGVAETWEVSDDGLVYTFHLRTDAKWSNGDPVTAHDFIYAWRRLLTPSLAAEYAYMLYCMKNAQAYNEETIDDFAQVGVKAPDAYTLEVTLEYPTPYFLSMQVHQTWFPVHRATIEKFGAIDERNTRWVRAGNFVGNGPFILTRWEPNNIIETRKSPTYWNADTVQLDGINFFPVSSEQTEERMFRSGELHMTQSVPLSKIPVYLKENPHLIRTDPYFGTYYYGFNVTRPPFDDVRVRRALALALDREAITTNVLKAKERPAPFLTPPGVNGYTSPARLDYDPEEARRLLAEAGYPKGEGFPKADILYNTSEAHRVIAVVIQQMWKTTLGIDVTLSNQDWKVYLDSTNNLEYDISRRAWIGDYVDPINFLELATTGNGNNRTGWGDPEFDALIAKARTVNNQDERNRLYGEAEAILIREVPIIPIYFYTDKLLIAPQVRGFQTNILGYRPWKRMSLAPADS